MQGWSLLWLLAFGGCLARHVKIKHPNFERSKHEFHQKQHAAHWCATDLIDLALIKQRTLELDSTPSDRDLEDLGSTTATEHKLVTKLYDMLLETATEDEGVSFDTLLSINSLIEIAPFRTMPPLEAMTSAIEEFSTYAGSDEGEITPEMLRSSYKDMFKLDLSKAEAQKMILNIQIDKKNRISANRCEFVTAVLSRNGFGGPLTSDINELWPKRSEWTTCDVLYELGTGMCSEDAKQLINTIYLAPANIDESGKLSKCAFRLLVSFIRDDTFRSFFSPESIPKYSPPKDLEMEAFLGKEVFPHSDQTNFEENAFVDRVLQDVGSAVDDNGDGLLDRNEFSTLVWVVDTWHALVPSLQDLKGYPSDVEVPTKFSGDELISPSVPQDPEFDRIWQSAIGPKTLYASNEKLKDYLLTALDRAGSPKDEHTLRMWLARYQQAKYYNQVLGLSNSELSKEEFRQALYGRPQVTRLLSKEVLSSALAMLMPAEDKQSCNRDCWNILGPLIRCFNRLDTNSDGTLSETEFSELGVSVLTRLASKLPGEAKPGVFAQLLKTAGTQELGSTSPKFKLPALIALFRSKESQTTPVTLSEFLDPPMLDDLVAKSGDVEPVKEKVGKKEKKKQQVGSKQHVVREEE